MDATVDPGVEHARVVGMLERAEREIEQLRRAVESRTVIGRAEGILMERFGIDADQALTFLRRASSHTNRKLVAIATEMAVTRELPLELRRPDEQTRWLPGPVSPD
jgi:AmiR/NasT family two-component response regulator